MAFRPALLAAFGLFLSASGALSRPYPHYDAGPRATSRSALVGIYRGCNLARNDTRRQLDWQLNMGIGSGRYFPPRSWCGDIVR